MTERWNAWRAPVRDAAIARVKAAGLEARLPADVCAALACLSYKADEARLDAALGQGWTFLGEADADFGYDAAALIHELSETLIILNRGTEFPGSLPDLKQSIAAIFDEDFGQIAEAIEFAAVAWLDAGATRPRRLKAIGHSLGGGLAEAQVAFFADEVRKRGETPPLSVSGLGLGSAGYDDAIRAVGVARGYPALEASRVFEAMTHFVRARDVVDELGFTGRLGSEKRLASLYEPELAPQQGGRGGPPLWTVGPNEVRNHDPLLYFAFLDIDDRRHLFWRWRRSKDILIRPDAAPDIYRRTQTPAEDM